MKNKKTGTPKKQFIKNKEYIDSPKKDGIIAPKSEKPSKRTWKPSQNNSKDISLLKYLQKNKQLSRRDFFDMVRRGIIFVNGQQIHDINHIVNIDDEVKMIFPNGETYQEIVKKMPHTDTKVIVFNKPKGYVVSKDDKFNKTIFEILPSSFQKDFYYIGRLDKDSHGLLLLTNNPELVDFYENPKNRILKIYEVKIDKILKTHDIVKFKKGINVDENGTQFIEDKKDKDEKKTDIFYENLKFFDIHKVQLPKHGEILRIVLNEGKKRHIRRALKARGYKTLDLKRIKVGKYELGDIKPGKYRIYKA